MDPLYREFIIDHYKHPRNFGELEPHDAEFHDVNPLCGDEMGVHIRLDGDRVADIRFHGQGCAISQATASIISDELKGKTVSEVSELLFGLLSAVSPEPAGSPLCGPKPFS